MKVVILGANGRVGSRVARTLIEHGHEVIAGVYKNTNAVPPQATIVEIDIHDQAAMTHMMNGADAVVCALSSWQAPNHDVLSTAMKVVIPAMEQAHVKRIVSISGDVARLPGESSNLFVKLFHMVAFGTVKAVVKDSEDHLRQLYDSDLDWTVIRPTAMSSSDSASYQFRNTHPIAMAIPRAAVVASIVDLIEHGDHIHEAPFIAPSKA